MWYLTYYEEYPIYEAAEGGYYYAGRDIEIQKEFATLNEALEFVPAFAEFCGLEDFTVNGIYDNEWMILGDFGDLLVAGSFSKYIGEDKVLYLETERSAGKKVFGWHPYE